MRVVQYLVLATVAEVLGLLADWPTIRQTLVHGLGLALWHTVAYIAGAFILSLVAGTLLALMRLSSVGSYCWLATAYIEFFRGLPALVVFIAFSLLPLAFPSLSIPFDPYGTVWLALGMVCSAYMAETIRAGI